MFNVGGGEIFVILLVALIVLGPDKLPSAARQVGKYLAEFRKISSGFQDELRNAMDITATPDPEPATNPPAPGGPAPADAPADAPAADVPAADVPGTDVPGSEGPQPAPTEPVPDQPGTSEASPIREVGPTDPTAA